MPARVSTGDRDAVLRQIWWCAAVQTLVNCYRKLEEDPVGNVKPMQPLPNLKDSLYHV